MQSGIQSAAPGAGSGRNGIAGILASTTRATNSMAPNPREAATKENPSFRREEFIV